MKINEHWASLLEIGDRVKVTIRHKNDGSKNLTNATVILIEQLHCINAAKVAYGKYIYTIPYNEFNPLTTPDK